MRAVAVAAMQEYKIGWGGELGIWGGNGALTPDNGSRSCIHWSATIANLKLRN